MRDDWVEIMNHFWVAPSILTLGTLLQVLGVFLALVAVFRVREGLDAQPYRQALTRKLRALREGPREATARAAEANPPQIEKATATHRGPGRVPDEGVQMRRDFRRLELTVAELSREIDELRDKVASLQAFQGSLLDEVRKQKGSSRRLLLSATSLEFWSLICFLLGSILVLWGSLV